MLIGINLLFEVEDFASFQNCELEVEWDYLYSFEYAPIIMLKCFINVYVPVHYRTVLFFCTGTTSFKRLRIVINRSILPL